MDVSKGSMKRRGRSSVSRLPPGNQPQRSGSMSCMARVRARLKAWGGHALVAQRPAAEKDRQTDMKNMAIDKQALGARKIMMREER